MHCNFKSSSQAIPLCLLTRNVLCVFFEHNLWSSSCALYIKLPVYQGETLAMLFLALPCM